MSISTMRTATRKRLRMIMAARDLTTNDLSTMTGYTPGYLRGVISGAFCSATAQKKIEEALNTPIWSDLATETTPTRRMNNER